MTPQNFAEALLILERQQSLQMCENALDFLHSILQKEETFPDLTMSDAKQLCINLKRTIHRRDLSIKHRVLSILTALLSLYNNNLEVKCRFIMMIPLYLLEIDMISLLCVTLNTLDPELFRSILDFLEQLCISSPPYSEKSFHTVLESVLRIGMLRINAENYSKDRFIQFYLILLSKMKNIPANLQCQVLNYYRILPDLSDSRVRLVALPMLTYCVDPALSPTVVLLVFQTNEYLEKMENVLNFKVDNLDMIGLSYTVANEILVRENQLTLWPQERRIKWTICSMLRYQKDLCTSHLTLLSSIFRADLKSSVILIEEESVEDPDEVLFNLLCMIQSLFTKIPQGQHDVLWEVLYELFGFVERREAMGKTGSSKLVCELVLQPCIEPMLTNLINSSNPMPEQIRVWRFSHKCLLFLQKWTQMIDYQVTNRALFRQKISQKENFPILMCRIIFNALSEEENDKNDLTIEHLACLITMKYNLMSLQDKLNIL